MSKKPQADNLPLPPLPETKFSCISIDPPWHFETRAPVKEPQSDRSPQKHYPTMSLEQIAQLPIRDIATKDAFVFLWITGPLVVNGAHTALMKRWRVTPVSTGFVWIKTTKNFDVNILGDTPLMAQDLHMGMGYTTRQNAEFVILGKIGNPKVARRDIRTFAALSIFAMARGSTCSPGRSGMAGNRGVGPIAKNSAPRPRILFERVSTPSACHAEQWDRSTSAVSVRSALTPV